MKSEEKAMELIIIKTYSMTSESDSRIVSVLPTAFVYYNWQRKKELIPLLILEDLVHHQEISPRLFK